MNTIRRRAIQYIEKLRENGFTNELPRDQAIDLFSRILDQWDRVTIKSYFGTVGHRSKRVFYQDSQYTSGTVSHKTITLSQMTKQTKGYLEKMGLVSFMLKKDVWFMKVEKAVLVPQLGEVTHVSMPNLYISPIARSGNVCASAKIDLCPIERLENKQQLEDEIYKSYNDSNKLLKELNPLEKAILRAKENG